MKALKKNKRKRDDTHERVNDGVMVKRRRTKLSKRTE
jgi:hypothetical protein